MIIKSILAATAIASMVAGASILSSGAASAKSWCGNPGQEPCVFQGTKTPPPNMPPPGKPPKPQGNNNGQPNFNLDITIGNGGGYDNGYGGNGGWKKPHYGYGGGYGGGPQFVSCMQAKSIVRYNGFRNVQTQSCGGPVYSFMGMRKGRLFEIDVSRKGRIMGVDPAY